MKVAGHAIYTQFSGNIASGVSLCNLVHTLLDVAFLRWWEPSGDIGPKHVFAGVAAPKSLTEPTLRGVVAGPTVRAVVRVLGRIVLAADTILYHFFCQTNIFFFHVQNVVVLCQYGIRTQQTIFFFPC